MRRTCPCGRPARERGLGHGRGYKSRPHASRRGDAPYLCVDCQRDSLRRSWRESKRRRAASRRALRGADWTPQPRVDLGYLVKRNPKSEAA